MYSRFTQRYINIFDRIHPVINCTQRVLTGYVELIYEHHVGYTSFFEKVSLGVFNVILSLICSNNYKFKYFYVSFGVSSVCSRIHCLSVVYVLPSLGKVF